MHIANNLLFRKNQRMSNEGHYVRSLLFCFLYHWKIAFIINENSDSPSSLSLGSSPAAGWSQGCTSKFETDFKKRIKIKPLALLLFKGRQIYPSTDKWTHDRFSERRLMAWAWRKDSACLLVPQPSLSGSEFPHFWTRETENSYHWWTVFSVACPRPGAPPVFVIPSDSHSNAFR